MDKAQVLSRLPSHCAGTSDTVDESVCHSYLRKQMVMYL